MHLRFEKYRLTFDTTLIFLFVLVTSCQSASTPTIYPASSLAPHSTPIVKASPTFTPELSKADLALGITCSPPCWLDIRPGITTLLEGRAVLERYSDEGIVTEWEEFNLAEQTPELARECPELVIWIVETTSGFADAVITGNIASNKVHRINISTHSLHTSYTLGQMVNYYGPPEAVSNLDSDLCSNCSTASWDPGETISLRAYYPSKGMMFSMSAPLSMHGCMCPDMMLGSIFYFTPISLAEFLSLPYPPNSICDSWLEVGIDEPVIEWHGFGPGY